MSLPALASNKVLAVLLTLAASTAAPVHPREIREGDVTTSDGVRIHYFDLGGDTGRTPIVLIHGYTGQLRVEVDQAQLALTREAQDRYGFRLRPQYGTSVGGDLGGYASLGIPRVQAIHAAQLHHTTGDTFETISVEGLERAARFYAYYLKGVAKAPKSQLADPPRAP
jgi:pimeloyl-ACP methyl ester carboxylesterase